MSEEAVITTCQSISTLFWRKWGQQPFATVLRQPINILATVSTYCGAKKHSESEHCSLFEVIPDIISKAANPIWLCGNNGCGKTTSLLWIANLLAQARIQNKSTYLPVYLDLGQVNQELAGDNLDDIIASQLQILKPVNYRPFKDRIDDCVFLLDGIDLLTGRFSSRTLFNQALNSELGKYVIAGRPQSAVTEILNDLESSVRIETKSLPKSETKKCLTQIVKNTAPSFELAFEKSNFPESVFTNPLMFALASMVLLESSESIDQNKFAGMTNFLTQFVESSIRRAQKNGRLANENEDLDIFSLSCSLGSIALESIRTDFLDRIPKSVTNALTSSSKLGMSWNTVRSVFLEAGLIEETARAFKFVHQDFADYFSGCALAREWLDFSSHPCFPSIVFNELAFKSRDGLVSHAVSFLRLSHDGNAITLRVFDFLRVRSCEVAVDVFAKSHDPKAIPQLLEVAANKTLPDHDREFATKAIGRIPHTYALAALQSIIHSSGEFLDKQKYQAIHAVRDSNSDSSIGILQNTVDDQSLPNWVRILAGIDSRIVFPTHTNGLFKNPLDGKNLAPIIQIEVFEFVAQRVFGVQTPRDGMSMVEYHFKVNLADNFRDRMNSLIAANPGNEEIKAKAIRFLSMFESGRSTGSEFNALVRDLFPTIETPGESNSVDLQINEFDPVRAVHRIFSMLDNRQAEIGPISYALLKICAESPRVFDTIGSHKLAKLLPKHTLAMCALASGRRWILEDISQDNSPLVADKSHKVKMEMPLLLSGFIKYCQMHRIEMTVNQCVIYSESINGNWSRASLAAAMKRHQVIKEYRKNKTLANKSRTTRKSKPR